MAHEFESGLFVGQPAWHGLGVVLRDEPSIEDAIKLAGLDWKVRLAPLSLTEDGRGVAEFAQATIRESDNSILGVVGPGYYPLQNTAAFKFFQPLVESGGVAIEAAGSLRQGRRVWVLARIKEAAAEVVPNDEIRQYVLLAHAHDGSLAIRVGFTSIRVVCANTLKASIEDGESALIKIKHTESAARALDKVRDTIDLARREFAATAEQLKELARIGCDERTLKRYVREVFNPLADPENELASARTVKQILPLFESGRGADLPGVRGTLWGAFNAITEFTTHVRGKTADTRVESAWFGDSAKTARRALNVGLQLARAA